MSWPDREQSRANARIGPALSPYEWRENDCFRDMSVSRLADECSPICSDRDDTGHWNSKDNCWHAAAALCLHGQPFGFTHADVRLLRYAADGFEKTDPSLVTPGWVETIRRWRELADRIAALLPPES